MTSEALTNYDFQANNFAQLPEYSLYCGTDYLAVRDVPQLIQQVKPLTKILDLGCGSGLATRYLKKHFPDALVIGADINIKMLEQARAADPAGIYLHLPKQKNEVAYPFLNDFFDVVTCSFVIHENRTLQDLQTFINNIAKILRPDGLFLAWDTYKNLFTGNWHSIETISPRQGVVEGQVYKVRLHPVHDAEVSGTYWSPETMEKIGNSAKLQLVKNHFPIAEYHPEIPWKDELTLAPYYLYEARKKI